MIKYKLEPGDIISIKYDFMFCEIFNNEENIFILEEFIADYFNYDIKDVKGKIKILSRKLKRISKNEPSKEVDLLLDYKGELRNVEISTGWSENIKDRNVVFLSKIHGNQTYKNYKDIKQTIQINLLAFNYRNKLKSEYFLADTSDKNNIDIFTKKLKVDVISMAIGKEMCYTNDNELNKIIKWSKIFMSKTKEELDDNLKLISKKAGEKLLSNVLHLSGDKDMLKRLKTKTKSEMEHESFVMEHEEHLREHEEHLKEHEEHLREHEEHLKEHNEIMKNLKKQKQQLDNEKEKLDNEKEKLDNEKEKLDNEKEKLDNIIQNKEHRKSLEIAEKLLKNKINIDIISNTTGLSKEEIENLK